MRNTFKLCLAFVSGMGVGACVTYALTHDRKTEEVEKIDISRMPIIRPDLQNLKKMEEIAQQYAETEHPEDERPRIEPREIDEEEFDENFSMEKSQQLTFYGIDGILCDENSNKIRNIDSFLTPELNDRLAKTNEEVIYVDDRERDTYYEIIIEKDRSYYEEVLGRGVGIDYISTDDTDEDDTDDIWEEGQ